MLKKLLFMSVFILVLNPTYLYGQMGGYQNKGVSQGQKILGQSVEKFSEYSTDQHNMAEDPDLKNRQAMEDTNDAGISDDEHVGTASTSESESTKSETKTEIKDGNKIVTKTVTTIKTTTIITPLKEEPKEQVIVFTADTPEYADAEDALNGIVSRQE